MKRNSIIGLAIFAAVLLIAVVWFISSGRLAFEFRPDPGTNEGRTKLDIDNILGGLGRFKRDTGRYPNTGEGLRSLLHNPGTAMNWKGPYLFSKGKPDSIILNDWFGKEYRYNISSGGIIEIRSAGLDAIFETNDDIWQTNSSSGP